MNGIVYKGICPNGKCYIGQTTNFHRRKIKHKSDSYNSNTISYNYYFHQAIRKHGFENLKWQILMEDINTQEQLDMWERLWIFVEKSNDRNFGYNTTEGGSIVGRGESHPLYGTKFSEESKMKMSLAKKGKRKIMSKEVRIKISNTLKGKSFPQERKNNISKAKKGQPWSAKRREAFNKSKGIL